MGESEYKARERAAIVSKYAQRTPEILPGEEGPENVTNIDLYGFIYPGPVPQSKLDKQQKIKKRDLTREKKWNKLLLKGNKSGKKSSRDEAEQRALGHTLLHLDDKLFRPKKTQEKLVRRVYDGIPTTFRSLIWTELLRMQGMRVNHEKYKEMVERAKKYSPDIHQIDLDVNRTYRNTSYFRERYGPRQRQLFDVLAAYSMYNTEVGYCQGMSEIAAFLLMHFNEEADVFWALHTLFTHQHWQMHGFFIKGFPKLNRFFDNHDRLLARHMPRLHKHLKKMDIHPSCYAFKWFMQCFIGLPFTLTLRLWDIFLVIGEKLLVVMSFNIMKIFRRTLLKMDQSEILVYMQEPLRRRLDEFDDDKIIEYLKDAMNELQHDWRPPKPTVPEGPPSPEQFGCLPEPHIVQERQLDQMDVEATLRRSFQRSGSPRPPSSPSGDAPRRSPPPALQLPDGSSAVAPDGAPPSPYDNAPQPGASQTAFAVPSPPISNPPPIGVSPGDYAEKPPMSNPPPIGVSPGNYAEKPPMSNPPPIGLPPGDYAEKPPMSNPPPIGVSPGNYAEKPPMSNPPPIGVSPGNYAEKPPMSNPPPIGVSPGNYAEKPPMSNPPPIGLPLGNYAEKPPMSNPPPISGHYVDNSRAPPPAITPVGNPIPNAPISQPGSKTPSIAGSGYSGISRTAAPMTYNGGVRSVVPKSNSLPEDVATASQLAHIKDYQVHPTRQIRSHDSSPLDTKAPPEAKAPLESTL